MPEQQNYYGSLCTELYELLHPEAPREELDFYLSYAAPGQRILEAMCGSGRFLVPFLERGFAIEGVDLSAEMLASRCPEDTDHQLTARVRTPEGYELLLKSKNHYDPQTQTQFMPGLYQLYDGPRLLRQESMDFQTHLYRFGEMEQLLAQIGFSRVTTYTGFSKQIAAGEGSEMFLFECRL